MQHYREEKNVQKYGSQLYRYLTCHHQNEHPTGTTTIEFSDYVLNIEHKNVGGVPLVSVSRSVTKPHKTRRNFESVDPQK